MKTFEDDIRVPAVQSRSFLMENSLLPGYVPLPLIQLLLLGRQYARGFDIQLDYGLSLCSSV